MAIYKNIAGQKIAVYAYDPTTTAGSDPSQTGDASNITAEISKDGAASAATNDVNPVELDAADHPGVYVFDLTQDETNADMIVISAVSATSNVLLDPIQVLTLPGGFKLAAGEIVIGAAEATPTTTTMQTDLAETTDDHYTNCHVIWTSGNLKGQRRKVTAYAGSTGTLTYETATEAPSASDTFVLV